MDDVITVDVSSVVAHPRFQLYLKGIKRSFSSIHDIKEALQNINPNLLSISSSSTKPASASQPQVATVSTTTDFTDLSTTFTNDSDNKYTQCPYDYCGEQRHNLKKFIKVVLKRRKSIVSLVKNVTSAEKPPKSPNNPSSPGCLWLPLLRRQNFRAIKMILFNVFQSMVLWEAPERATSLRILVWQPLFFVKNLYQKLKTQCHGLIDSHSWSVVWSSNSCPSHMPQFLYLND